MWQPINTAPQDGTKFLATDGKLLGIGYHYREVEPDTTLCTKKWNAYYAEIHAPFRVPFTPNGLFPEGFNYLENCRLEAEAWDRVKDAAPPFERVPNPKAGQVKEWDYASAFYAFDGESATQDYDGPIGFTPTHWMPLPEPLAVTNAQGEG